MKNEQYIERAAHQASLSQNGKPFRHTVAIAIKQPSPIGSPYLFVSFVSPSIGRYRRKFALFSR